MSGEPIETAKDVAPEVMEALNDLFIYHAPTEAQKAAYQTIRDSAKTLALVIYCCTPAGPDRTAAIRKVREAVMTANAGIATHNAAARVR